MLKMILYKERYLALVTKLFFHYFSGYFIYFISRTRFNEQFIHHTYNTRKIFYYERKLYGRLKRHLVMKQVSNAALALFYSQ